MTVSEKLLTIADNVDRVFLAGEDYGILKGIEYGNTECSLKHYVNVIEGDGSKTIEFRPPFKPDYISVFAMSPLVDANNLIFSISFDLRSFWRICCLVASAQSGTEQAYQAGLGPSAMTTRYSIEDDMTVKLYNLPSKGGAVTGVFANGVPYTIIAVKNTDKSDSELFTDFINGLPVDGSGTLKVSQYFIENAFTQAEYEALFDLRPGYTFTLK